MNGLYSSCASRASSRPAFRGRCQRRFLQVGCRQQPVNEEPEKFFNRTTELSELDKLIKSKPALMKVIFGPRNSGKTRFITHYLEGKSNAIYIDCRVIDAKRPQAFISALLEALAMAAPRNVVKQVLEDLWRHAPRSALAAMSAVIVKFRNVPGGSGEKMSSNFENVFKALQAQSSQQPAQEDMKAVFKALQDLLAAWEQDMKGRESPWPVLVIDEVNMMMAWKAVDPDQLATLLALLVAISKQQRQCHVLLLTAEYGFQSWLQHEVGTEFFDEIVIGDFAEKDAREFLHWELQQQGCQLAVNDRVWRRVYKVCGGNAGSLVRLAQEVYVHPPSNDSDWFAALDLLCRRGKARIEELALGGDDVGWTDVQYAAAVQALLDSKYHAVPQLQMKQILGRCAVGDTASIMKQIKLGEVALENLVAANALSIRPFSTWSTDIPAAAFVNRTSVVTAPSAMDLHCMEIMLQLLSELEQEQDGTKDAMCPDSPSSLPELQDAQDAIHKLQAAVGKFQGALDARVATDARDKDEVAALHEQVSVLQEQIAALHAQMAVVRQEELVLLRKTTMK